jgi:hypothetical protein
MSYALDHCCNLDDFVAVRILASRWGSPDSRYFGDRRDRGGNQTRHRARGVGVRIASTKIERLDKTPHSAIRGRNAECALHFQEKVLPNHRLPLMNLGHSINEEDGTRARRSFELLHPQRCGVFVETFRCPDLVSRGANKPY